MRDIFMILVGVFINFVLIGLWMKFANYISKTFWPFKRLREKIELQEHNINVKVGEVCLLTQDVVKLANFYKSLLEVDNQSQDLIHQTIIGEETMLTIYNDGTQKNNNNQNICIAFTVGDIEKAYEKVKNLGAQIIAPPKMRPWGACNMSFYDPDGNMVFLRKIVTTTNNQK